MKLPASMTLRSACVCFAALGVSLGLVASTPAHLQGSDDNETASPAQESSEKKEHPRVKTEVLFDVDAFVPGKLAHLVVILKVPKAWHIYWESAGESGMGTSLMVTGPEGWEIGPVNYPGPQLYRDGEGNLCHTLEGEVGLFVPITPPDDAETGEAAEFRIKGQWLQCQDICLMGELDTEVELPVRRGLPKRNPDRRLVGLRSVMPRRGHLPPDIGFNLSGRSSSAHISFSSIDAREFEFIAFSDSPLSVPANSRKDGSKTETFSQRIFDLKPTIGEGPDEIEVHGVLRVQRKEFVSFYEVRLKGPQSRPPSTKPLSHGSLPVVPRKESPK